MADKAVELGFVDSIAKETVRQILKKNKLKPWLKKSRCIGEITSQFIAAMEDPLTLYEEDFDALRAVVCFDETSKQSVRQPRVAWAASCGQVERFDYQYKRNGVANLFMRCQPKTGWRHVEVTDRHTKLDFAEQMKYPVDEAFPEAEKIGVVMGNPSRHSGGAV